LAKMALIADSLSSIHRLPATVCNRPAPNGEHMRGPAHAPHFPASIIFIEKARNIPFSYEARRSGTHQSRRVAVELDAAVLADKDCTA
jgi:hypothetical protein